MINSHDLYFIPEIPILYIDPEILVVNKPAGLLTIRDGYNPEAPYLSRLLEPQYGRLWIVHRLDKDTSGVLIFVRSASAHRNLNIQFENHQVKKEYQAMVNGVPSWDQHLVDFPLRVNGDRRHRTIVDPITGKPAATRLSVDERFASNALLIAHPESGYTHQIRAHLALAGFPILFDPLYGSKPQTTVPDLPESYRPRLALHAASVSYLHPTTIEPMTVSAPFPADLQVILSTLRNK